MLQEQRAVQRIRRDAPRAQTVEDRAREACVFEYLASHLSAVALNDAIDYVAEEGFVVAEEMARGPGGVEGVMRGLGAAVGVEVELVDVRAGGRTGAGGHGRTCALSL